MDRRCCLIKMKRLICLVIMLLSWKSFAQNIETEKVIVEPFTDNIARSGKLAFKNTLLLSFKTNGYLKTLTVDEGDAFTKNQILASMDITELKADKDAKYAQLLQAKREVTRIRKLLPKQLSSQQALDAAQTQVETARSAYRVALYNLDTAMIKVPFDGVVLQRFTDLGELQVPGKSVLRVAAINDNWVVKVALTGNEISQVRLGQPVTVTLANKGKIAGKIVKIPAMANGDSNLFVIDILLPDLNLFSGAVAGQIADVDIQFSSDDFVYRLPIDALIDINEQGQAIVLTLSENSQEYTHQYFDIHKMDNHYLYLAARPDESDLQVVVRGWQNINAGK